MPFISSMSNLSFVPVADFKLLLKILTFVYSNSNPNPKLLISNLAITLHDRTIDIERWKIDCLRFVMCPLVAPGFEGFYFLFLMQPLTVLRKQTRHAGRAIKQSILLRCLWTEQRIRGGSSWVRTFARTCCSFTPPYKEPPCFCLKILWNLFVMMLRQIKN